MKHLNLVGVDISDSSIKLLQLDRGNTILAYGSCKLEPGVVEQGTIVNKELFSAALNKILKETKPNVIHVDADLVRAVICIPESKLYTHYIQIPAEMNKSERESFIKKQAEDIIPFTLDEMYWDYHVVIDKKNECHATFVGVVKAVLDNYIEAFAFSHIKPAFVVGELFALGYALLPENWTSDTDYMMVDIGANTTTVGVFGDDAVANWSVVLPYGGIKFTQSIADALSVPLETAEKLKREYGMLDTTKKPEVTEALHSEIKILFDKITEAKNEFEKRSGNPVVQMILAGGSAQLPGLIVFAAKHVGIPATIANPLLKIRNPELFEQGIPGILFANVIGLALYAHDSDQKRINLLTQYRYEESDTEKTALHLKEIRSLNDAKYVLFQWRIKLEKSFSFLKIKIRYRIPVQLIGTVVFLLCTIAVLYYVVLKYLL